MNLMLKMAYANLWRRRNRTLVVIAMIAFGIAGLMFMQGFYDGMVDGMKRSMIRTGTGHITVQNEKFKRTGLLKDALVEPAAVKRALEALPEVVAVAPKLAGEGLAASSRFSRGVRIVGVDLGAEERHGRISDYLVAGELGFGEKERGAIIGATLAEKMKLKVGKKIILTTQAADKSLSSAALRVKGILKTDNPYVDKQAVFLSFGAAERLFGVTNTVSYYTVRLRDGDRGPEAAKAALLKRIPEGNTVYTWREYYPLIHQFEEIMGQFYGIMYLVVFTVVAIGIFDIVLISVLERVRELGIMMAVGTKFWQIGLLVMTESLVIGLFGFAAGSAAGSGLLWYFHTFGLDLSFATEGLQNFGIASVIYAAYSPAYLLWALTAVVGATVIASLFPIAILKKRKPIDVIRFT